MKLLKTGHSCGRHDKRQVPRIAEERENSRHWERYPVGELKRMRHFAESVRTVLIAGFFDGALLNSRPAEPLSAHPNRLPTISTGNCARSAECKKNRSE